MAVTFRDLADTQAALREAGELPLPMPCPEDGCGGDLYFDRDVETTTGRIVPVMAVCAKCFYTLEVKL